MASFNSKKIDGLTKWLDGMTIGSEISTRQSSDKNEKGELLLHVRFGTDGEKVGVYFCPIIAQSLMCNFISCLDF